MRPPIYAYFDKGQVPDISCVYLSSVDLSSKYKTFTHLIATLQRYADECLTPVWGMTCRLTPRKSILPKTWGFVFLDDADIASALGYHELTKEGFPLSKTFVNTSLNSGEEPSVTAAHELAEMLLDPAIQLAAAGPRNTFFAYELCDAVERDTFLIDGIPMSNFVYPSWFEGFRKPRSTQFDYMNLCTRPFEIRRGGYMPIHRNGKWTQVFANKADEKKFNELAHPRLMMRKANVTQTSKKRKINAKLKRAYQEHNPFVDL